MELDGTRQYSAANIHPIIGQALDQMCQQIVIYFSCENVARNMAS